MNVFTDGAVTTSSGRLFHELTTLMENIGVNHPAIVREIPHFSLFPAFPHFLENVPHFWLYFEKQKIPENRDNSWRQKEFVCVILVSH